jgi:hypothetical protein
VREMLFTSADPMAREAGGRERHQIPRLDVELDDIAQRRNLRQVGQSDLAAGILEAVKGFLRVKRYAEMPSIVRPQGL